MEQRFLGLFLRNTEPLGKLATVRFNFMFGGTLSFKTLYFFYTIEEKLERFTTRVGKSHHSFRKSLCISELKKIKTPTLTC